MKKISHIIAPVDLEVHTEQVIEYAAGMAENLSAKLTLVHVVQLLPDMGHIVLEAATIESIKECNTKRLDQAKEKIKKFSKGYPNCWGKVIEGDIVDEIVNFAEKERANLIIIATHGSKGVEHLLLGSVAERVVKNAGCPTLLFNPFKQTHLWANNKDI